MPFFCLEHHGLEQERGATGGVKQHMLRRRKIVYRLHQSRSCHPFSTPRILARWVMTIDLFWLPCVFLLISNESQVCLVILIPLFYFFIECFLVHKSEHLIFSLPQVPHFLLLPSLLVLVLFCLIFPMPPKISPSGTFKCLQDRVG